MPGSCRLVPFALLVCTTAPSLAQEAAILQDLARAEQALAERRAEDAALLVTSAGTRVRALPDSAVRTELQQRVLAVREKADPVGKSRDEACAEAGAALVRAALAYEDRGWLRSASALLLRAMEIAPDLAEDALARVRERQGHANTAPSASSLVWLQQGEVVEGPSPWLLDAASVVPASPTASEPVGIHLGGLRVRSERIRMQADVDARKDFGIGLVFAYRHSQNFYVAMVKPSGDRQFARILRAEGNAYATLAEEWLPSMPPAKAEGDSTPAPVQALRLLVDGTSIEFRVDAVTLRATAKEPLPNGFLGLQVEHAGKDGTAPRLTGVAFEAEETR